ncbi:MAG: DUF4115 domain-containing protein [Acidobacteria bacterium]|nr:DUF4115 domain-containing protein [Acidobacteriota bacterium]
MRGVSLDEISQSTKIGTRSLQALEENDFEKLPGGIFNKGFVRAYSRFLGLDEERMIADFDSAFKEYKLARGLPAEPPVFVEQEPEDSTAKVSSGFLVTLVLIAAAAAGGYLFMRSRWSDRNVFVNPPATQTHAAPREEPKPANNQTSSAAAITEPPSSTQIPEPTSSMQKQNAAPVSSIAPTKAPTESQLPTSAKLEAPIDSTTAAAVSQSAIRLKVFAREESWLSISADGQNLGQQLLAPQHSRTIHAQKEVRLKLGNVGGVEVSFNGKPVNIDGEPKQVKELTFTPDGLHQ